MDATAAFAVVIVFAALTFDFANGWHDAANSIATVVSTRVLRPGVAVVWAAAFNFLAFLVFGTHVAKTVGGGLVDIGRVTDDWRLWVLLCALIGAIAWDVVTWYFGLPSSSSHALVGGYAGAAITAQLVTGGAIGGLLQAKGWILTLSFIVLSPLLGMVLGFFNMVAILWIFRRSSPDRVDHIFRKGQLRLGGRLLAGARGQRRPEDHGHHHRRAGGRRLPGLGPRRRACPTSRCGWCSRPTPPSPWAP